MENGVILGCGYVGMAVARRWYPQMFVTATTTTPERVPELEPVAHQVRIVKGNDEAGLRSLLQGQQIVLVCVGPPRSDAYAETYLETAKTLVTVLPEVPSIQQVIYTGSYAVYGDRQGAWVDETTPIAPANSKGEILAETERVLLGAARPHLKVCLFRLGGIYGPGRELVKIYRYVAGTRRPGGGEDAANWVHLEDIVGAIDFARQQKLDGIYNLVATQPTTAKALIDQVCAVNQLTPVIWDPTQTSTRPYNARVSNQKLRQASYQFMHPSIEVKPGS